MIALVKPLLLATDAPIRFEEWTRMSLLAILVLAVRSIWIMKGPTDDLSTRVTCRGSSPLSHTNHPCWNLWSLILGLGLVLRALLAGTFRF